MASSGTGKFIVAIGAIIGIVSIILFFISDAAGAWWQVTRNPSIGSTQHWYMNVFGQFQDQESFDPEDLTLGFYGILVAILVILGSVLGFVAIAKQAKAIGILGAVLIIGGIVLFLISLNDVEGFQDVISVMEFFSSEDYNVFFGNAQFLGAWSWSLSFGFFMAAAAGILILIGTFMLD
ncbi:MAG: membrane protein of unknown function [Promethearchaeota archaeon]|nr:MAG: membrane protein of unknown function [Candidatus Lokiarchaeota archaeon]